MPLFDISINVLLFIVLIGLSVWSGFAFRSRQLAKKCRQIAALEREMLELNAEVLAVQKESCELEARLQQLTIPVIPINQAAKDDILEKKELKPGEIMKQKRSGGSA
jgi:hypothetical protein